jgi:hypothetical protein
MEDLAARHPRKRLILDAPPSQEEETVEKSQTPLQEIQKSPIITETMVDDSQDTEEPPISIETSIEISTLLQTMKDTTGPPLATESAKTKEQETNQADQNVINSVNDDTIIEINTEDVLLNSQSTQDSPIPHKNSFDILLGSQSQKNRQTTIKTTKQLQTFQAGDSHRHTWRLHLDNNTKTLIIGDSNMKHAQTIPDGWKICAFSGMNMSHLPNVLKNTTGSAPTRIVLTIGINDRDNEFETQTAPLMDTAISKLKEKFPNAEHYAVGISSKELPTRMKENIANINNKLSIDFGKNFIKPLNSMDIGIAPDRFKIHHNQVTVDKILNSIIARLN